MMQGAQRQNGHRSGPQNLGNFSASLKVAIGMFPDIEVFIRKISLLNSFDSLRKVCCTLLQLFLVPLGSEVPFQINLKVWRFVVSEETFQVS